MRRNSSCSCSRVCASSAPNGSSMNRTIGWRISARAMPTRCCMPPEISCGKCRSKPAQPDELDVAFGNLEPLFLADAIDLERNDRRCRAPCARATGRNAGIPCSVLARAIDRLAIDADPPLIDLDEPGDDAQQRGLAAAAWSQRSASSPRRMLAVIESSAVILWMTPGSSGRRVTKCLLSRSISTIGRAAPSTFSGLPPVTSAVRLGEFRA